MNIRNYAARRMWAADAGGGAAGGAAEMGAPEKTYTQAQLDLAVQAAVEKAVNAKVKELDAQHRKALEEKDMDFALRGALTDAHDAALVMGLLDRSKLKLEDGKIKGLDEQLGGLRKSKSFLFAPKQEDKPKPPPITGAHPADAGGAGQPGAKYTREQIAAMRPQEINAHWAEISQALGGK